jgi:hypothetical protein
MGEGLARDTPPFIPKSCALAAAPTFSSLILSVLYWRTTFTCAQLSTAFPLGLNKREGEDGYVNI